MTKNALLIKAAFFGWSGSGSVIQDLFGSWCNEETDESITRMDSSVPLMHHDPGRSSITDPDPGHPKGMHPLFINSGLKDIHYVFFGSPCIIQNNLFYLTVNNEFIIGREVGLKGKGDVCITTDNLTLNAIFSLLKIWWRRTNFSISKTSYFVFGFLSCCFVNLIAGYCCVKHKQINGDPFQENTFHLFLKAICGMLALSFLGWKAAQALVADKLNILSVTWLCTTGLHPDHVRFVWVVVEIFRFCNLTDLSLNYRPYYDTLGEKLDLIRDKCCVNVIQIWHLSYLSIFNLQTNMVFILNQDKYNIRFVLHLS